ncbi:MAG: peptidoglycan DD-metalloendopeptidase family protein [Gammaproteobacteria bacterium]|nr:peptidoglycan DD-metalloendopeptidase family protein [Gammaproteobacteria bacterium]
MDSRSYLSRDFKSLKEQRRSHSNVRYNRLQMTLIFSIFIVLATILAFLAHDAEAMRSPTLDEQAENTTEEDAIPALLDAVDTTTTTSQAPIADPEPVWEEIKVKAGDSLAVIFQRMDLNAHELDQIMKLGEVTSALRYLRPGQRFKFLLDEENNLQRMIYERSRRESLHIERDQEGFKAVPIELFLNKEVRFVTGNIKNSLFEAGMESGLSDALVMEMVDIFGWDIDFASDIRKGDRFNLLYEEQYLDGEKISEGPIIAAEFVNQGRTYQAIRYTDERGRSHYYTPDGHSMRKAFLRTPVDFRRISSHFGRRHHPILNQLRLHKGVDYAASRGTPIKAAGDGRVVYRGRKGGYGRTVIIQHGKQYSTLYAHMSRYKKGIYTGSRVRQGQIIGYVGRSGRATGDHLHYEFRVNGQHRNPLTVKLPNASPIEKKYKEDYLYHSQKILAQLMTQKQQHLAQLSGQPARP